MLWLETGDVDEEVLTSVAFYEVQSSVAFLLGKIRRKSRGNWPWLLLPFFEAKSAKNWGEIDPDFCCLSFRLRIRQNHTLDSPKWRHKRLAENRRESEEIDPFLCCLFWGNEGRIAKTGFVPGSGSRFQTSVAFLQGLVFRRKIRPPFFAENFHLPSKKIRPPSFCFALHRSPRWWGRFDKGVNLVNKMVFSS